MNSHSLFHFSEQSTFEEIQHKFIKNIFTAWICLEFWAAKQFSFKNKAAVYIISYYFTYDMQIDVSTSVF